MSKVFACSDTHFGHENIIRYCRRPFGSAASMNEAMIERWNSRVSPEDTVYFLGDFAMGPGVTEEFVIGTLMRLNGFKRIIKGNHDQAHKKYNRGLHAIVEDHLLHEDDDFPVVFENDIHEVQIDGTYFVMCHYPMNDWNGRFHGAVHLHGHCHSRVLQDPPSPLEGDKVYTQLPNGMYLEGNSFEKARYDVGVDSYGGPVQITGDCRYLNDPKGWDE